MPVAKVNFSKENLSAIEIGVPKGTGIAELAKIYQIIDEQLGKQLHPRGCGSCLSGSHFIVREILDGAAKVKF